MKLLTLVRHAQAESALAGQSDFDRMLTRRGSEDAAAMAKRLKLVHAHIDFVLCSPAPRARATAEIFARVLKIDDKHLDADDRLYTAGPNEYMMTLLEYAQSHRHILIAAHNPGISEFADKLSGERRLEGLPTCGVVTMQFKIRDWNDIQWHQGTHVEFDYPNRTE